MEMVGRNCPNCERDTLRMVNQEMYRLGEGSDLSERTITFYECRNCGYSEKVETVYP